MYWLRVFKVTKAQRKFLIGFGLILASWHIFHVPAVQHAFLQFLAVGEVPGLREPLSPQAIYLLLASIFSLSLILIFRREFMRSLRRSHLGQDGFKSQDRKAHDLGARMMTGDVAVIIPQNSKKPLKTSDQKLLLGDRSFPAVYMPAIMPSVWRFIDWEMRVIVNSYHRLRFTIKWVWKYSVIGSKAAWRWAEPRIRQLDKKIEKQLRNRKLTASALDLIEEFWNTLRLTRTVRRNR